MAWVLTDGLDNLRQQVNRRWPDRDKKSDGSIGDFAHSLGSSGHNPDDTAGSKPAWSGDPDSKREVRAWDMDNDLREGGTTAQDIVDHIRKLPGVGNVLRYMIYNRRIYHVRDGFTSAPYSGPSPHTEHIHFEGAWTQAADNNTTFDYRLEQVGDDMPITAADAKLIAAAIMEYKVPVGTSEWPFGNAVGYVARKAFEIDKSIDDERAEQDTPPPTA
jgi:hypothetical protein